MFKTTMSALTALCLCTMACDSGSSPCPACDPDACAPDAGADGAAVRDLAQVPDTVDTCNSAQRAILMRLEAEGDDVTDLERIRVTHIEFSWDSGELWVCNEPTGPGLFKTSLLAHDGRTLWSCYKGPSFLDRRTVGLSIPLTPELRDLGAFRIEDGVTGDVKLEIDLRGHVQFLCMNEPCQAICRGAEDAGA